MQFVYLGGVADTSADIILEIQQYVRLAWSCHNRFKGEPHYIGGCPFHTKGASAKCRDDARPDVRVCDLEFRP